MLEVCAETCWIFASVTFTITVSLFVCIGDKKNGKVGSRHGLLRQNADGRRSKSRDLTKKHSIMRSRLGGAEPLKVEKSERLSVHGEEVWSDRDVSKTAMGVPSDITQQQTETLRTAPLPGSKLITCIELSDVVPKNSNATKSMPTTQQMPAEKRMIGTGSNKKTVKSEEQLGWKDKMTTVSGAKEPKVAVSAQKIVVELPKPPLTTNITAYHAPKESKKEDVMRPKNAVPVTTQENTSTNSKASSIPMNSGEGRSNSTTHTPSHRIVIPPRVPQPNTLTKPA